MKSKEWIENSIRHWLENNLRTLLFHVSIFLFCFVFVFVFLFVALQEESEPAVEKTKLQRRAMYRREGRR